jgi:hypothetical protein
MTSEQGFRITGGVSHAISRCPWPCAMSVAMQRRLQQDNGQGNLLAVAINCFAVSPITKIAEEMPPVFQLNFESLRYSLLSVTSFYTWQMLAAVFRWSTARLSEQNRFNGAHKDHGRRRSGGSNLASLCPMYPVSQSNAMRALSMITSYCGAYESERSRSRSVVVLTRSTVVVRGLAGGTLTEVDYS